MRVDWTLVKRVHTRSPTYRRPMCGNHLPDAAKLVAHFEKLHTREHEKRMRAFKPGKIRDGERTRREKFYCAREELKDEIFRFEGGEDEDADSHLSGLS